MFGAKRKGVLIAGGGLAGSLAALALARHRPEVPILIVEEKDRFGGDGFRSVFGRSLDEDAESLIEPLLDHRWPGFFIAFPGLSRNLKSDLGGFEGDAIHREMIAALRPDQYRLGTRVVAVREDSLVLDGGETVKADGAIDARGASNLSMLDLLFETRIERVVRLESAHGLDRPVLIDSTDDDQSAGFSFVRCFPLGENRLLVTQSLVSERSQPPDWAGARLDQYLRLRGWTASSVESEVPAVRPLPFGGDFDAFWRIGGARVARLGLRGGFLQPATGSGVADSARNALLLAAQSDFAGPALHELFEQEARQLWKARQPLRDYVAALQSTAPAARRALAKRLYESDPGLIARFHSARVGLMDRLKLRRLFGQA